MDEIKSYLADLYDQISFRRPREKCVQILTIIIDLKKENPSISNAHNSLYLDVKRFISAYLRNKRIKDYGYEDYDYEIIRGYIKDSDFDEEQIYKLLEYTKYILSSLSYEYEWVDKLIKKSKIKLAWKKHKLKCVLLASSWNSWTLLASVFLIFVIECIALLPAPFEWMAVYDLEKVTYTECGFFNHILNVVSLHFDCIENSAKLHFSSWGIVGLVVWNVVYVVVGVNFLFKNLFSNFDLDGLDK